MSAEIFTTILRLVDQYKTSDSVALVCGEETLTYRQLIADAKHIARALIADGLKRGDRILYRIEASAYTIRGIFGILYAGGSYIAADSKWPEDRIRYIMQDGQALRSLTDEDCRRLLAGENSRAELPEITGEEEAAVYYTSGSTGEPKGVVLCHIVLGACLGTRICTEPWQLPRSSSDPEISQKPILSWDSLMNLKGPTFIGFFCELCTTFSQGKTMILPTETQKGSVELLTGLIRQHHPDIIAGTPSMFLRFLEHPDFAQAFADLRCVSFGGEMLIPAVLERLRSLTKGLLRMKYGSTETVSVAEYFYKNDGKVYLGTPNYGVTIHLLNEDMEPIHPGQEGELFIGGPAARYGYYLNRPDLNKKVYVEHPRFGKLFRMGDIGRLEGNGEITLSGRRDGMVKLHGQRIETAEVENRVERFKGIRQAAVRLTGTSPREALACWYTVSDEGVSESQLRRFLAAQLPYYMVPTLYMKLESMPENEHGKRNYRILPDIPVPEQTYCAPETDSEKLLCEIFAEVLETKDLVSVNDSFFALGGDSISALKAASRLRKRGYTFEISWIFSSPTARQLAPLLTKVGQQRQPDEPCVYAMTAAQRAAIEKSPGFSQVECVYPVAPELRRFLLDGDPWMQYQLYEIPAEQMASETLIARMKELTETYVMLRSVFACPEREEPLQVVLKHHDPECFFVDLRRMSQGNGLSEKQKSYFWSLIRLLDDRPKDLTREVLFRVGMIRITERVSILLFVFSHLLLDGASMSRIVRELL